MADRAELSDVAQRCVDDPEYARGLLEGDDYPEVKAALLADLGADAEVKGYLNPQPLPPKEAFSQDIRPHNWGMLVNRWSSMEFLQTRGIIIVSG
jgi:hypothetical protein